jgi:hypothetical protein
MTTERPDAAALVLVGTRWLIGLVWLLSWFALYLEICRYHHVTFGMLLDPGSWFPRAGQRLQPGTFLTSVLVCSAVVPVLYGLLRLIGDRSRQLRFAFIAIPFGSLVAVIGGINQVIRPSPLTVDLTLREGNGGFVVLGVALAVIGLVWVRGRT